MRDPYPIRRALERTLECAAPLLTAWPAPIREPYEFKLVLRQLLDATGVIALDETERTVKLDGFPGVGGVDMAGIGPDGEVILIELKYGTLYNCAWDAPKLALALREGQGDRAFLIAGGPCDDFMRPQPGAGLLGSAEWDTGALLDRHAKAFAKFRRQVTTRPRRLPDRFATELAADVPYTRDDIEWSLRCAEVIAPESPWMSIDEEGVAVLSPTGAEPVIEPAEELAEEPATRLWSGEGGSVYLVGETNLLTDEGTLAGMLPEDERDNTPLRHFYRFESGADLEAYARGRGWLESRGASKTPSALSFELTGYSPDLPLSVDWRFGELVVVRAGEEHARMPTRPEWESFWREVEELAVWNWRRRYTADLFGTDQLGFRLVIAHGGHLVRSSGYAAFPPAGSANPSALATLLAPLGIELFPADSPSGDVG